MCWSTESLLNDQVVMFLTVFVRVICFRKFRVSLTVVKGGSRQKKRKTALKPAVDALGQLYSGAGLEAERWKGTRY